MPKAKENLIEKHRKITINAITAMPNDMTEGYYPTENDLIMEYDVYEDPVTYYPMVAYFASDPFTRADNEKKSEPEYQKTVKYCQRLLADEEFINAFFENKN